MRRSRSLLPGRAALLSILWALVAAGAAAAATATIPVTGVVRDAQSGAPIADAVLSIPGLHRTVSSDKDGRYTIDMPAGTRRVTVQRIGYAPHEFEALVPASGVLEINVALRREPILLPPIEVHARVPVRGLEHSDAAFPDRSISQDALYQHPLLTEPDYLRALGGGEVVLEPESPSGLHVRGGAADQVAYLVDGIPVFNPFHAAGTFSAWNPDAMASVDLIATTVTPAAPDALSGVVSANTRTPGDAHHTSGSLSATQARAMADGPLGRTGAGYLVSAGSAFPGLLLHKDEASHLNGENVDLLGKIESPLLGGRVRVLGYGSQNEVDTAAYADTGDVDIARNEFQWRSRSAGAEWTRPVANTTLTLRSWVASGDANASWAVPDSTESVTARRGETGVLAMLAFPLAGGRSTAGARLQRGESRYDFRSLAGEAMSLDVTTPVSTAFIEHERGLTARGTVGFSFASAFFANDYYLSPGVQVRWRLSRSLMASASAARRHQFGQSLRNAESVVSAVFPADLYVGAGEGGVPVSHSNIGILALEHRPHDWLRLGCQAYLRDFTGLALVAPRTAGPFATGGFVTGTGDAFGFSLEASASRSHYGLLASYGYQDVSLSYPDGAYVPGYGAVHSFEAGIVCLPAPTYSVRLAFQSILGRRSTSALGSLEYEAVNLLDQGGEFAGSPYAWSEALGASTLPAYYRFDLGVRKQWRTHLGGRAGLLAVFGTVSNLMGRTNVLTHTVDPSTGERTAIEMRPLSPLVVGIDWHF